MTVIMPSECAPAPVLRETVERRSRPDQHVPHVPQHQQEQAFVSCRYASDRSDSTVSVYCIIRIPHGPTPRQTPQQGGLYQAQYLATYTGPRHKTVVSS